MTVVVQRLDRDSAIEMLAHHRGLDLGLVSAAMPNLSPVVTYSPVGGARIEPAELETLRVAMLDLASEHGMPGPAERLQEFEGRGARLVHELLPMTPHEASHEEVWSFLTCCWLLDIAFWRFGQGADEARFIGHLNRNTFRRMWWRAEVLGPQVDLTRLGEDELVSIMERPTIASDCRLARSVVLEFLVRVESDAALGRMTLMREGTKRLLRLTPFVAFPALEDAEVLELVSDVFDAAAAAIAGEAFAMPVRKSESAPRPSPEVTDIPTMTIVKPECEVDNASVATGRADDFDEVAQAALDIARRTGRVTNLALREVVPITPEEARAVLQTLVERGELARRGVAKGTHYVLPEQGAGPSAPEPQSPQRSTPPPTWKDVGQATPPERPRGADTALRRLLRRGR